MFRPNQFFFRPEDPPGDPPAKQDPPKQDPPKVDPPKQDPPGPVPYERFKEVNDALKKANDRLSTLESADEERKKKDLADQNKWKELYEAEQQKVKQEQAARLRLQVASSKGIPVDLADRLQGDTLEALEADADKLLPLLKPASGPGVPPPKKGGGNAPLDINSMTPAQIREHEAELLKQARSA